MGILTGLMFLDSPPKSSSSPPSTVTRDGSVIFGVLLAAAGIVALIHPSSAFAGFADILGFVFALIGVMWMVQACAERPINSLWWLTDQRDHDDRARVLVSRQLFVSARTRC